MTSRLTGELASCIRQADILDISGVEPPMSLYMSHLAVDLTSTSDDISENQRLFDSAMTISKQIVESLSVFRDVDMDVAETVHIKRILPLLYCAVDIHTPRSSSLLNLYFLSPQPPRSESLHLPSASALTPKRDHLSAPGGAVKRISLHQTILESIRLTDRNSLKWIQQILSSVLFCHSNYICVGDISTRDIYLCSDEYMFNVMEQHRQFYAQRNVKNEERTSGYDMGRKIPVTSDRNAWIDFCGIFESQCRKGGVLKEFQGSSPGREISKASQLQKNSMLRRPLCALGTKLLQSLDEKKNGVCRIRIIDPNHSTVAISYKDWAENVHKDLRCIGIMILELTLHTVLDEKERRKLSNVDFTSVKRNAQASLPLPRNQFYGGENSDATHDEKEEEEEEEEPRQKAIYKQGLLQSTQLQSGNHLAIFDGECIAVSSDNDNSSMKTKSRIGKEKEIYSTFQSNKQLVKQDAAVEITSFQKVENEMASRFPVIHSLHPTLKELLISCFLPFEQVIKNNPVSNCEESEFDGSVDSVGRKIDTFEFALFDQVRKINAKLQSVVFENIVSSKFKKRSTWTKADDVQRQNDEALRSAYMSEQAEIGPVAAAQRVKQEAYKLWFSQQSDEYKARVAHRRAARTIYYTHRREYDRFIHLGSVQWWPLNEFKLWTNRGFLHYFHHIHRLQIEITAMERGKKRRKADNHIVKQVNLCFKCFDASFVDKILLHYFPPAENEDGAVKNSGKKSRKVENTDGSTQSKSGASSVSSLVNAVHAHAHDASLNVSFSADVPDSKLAVGVEQLLPLPEPFLIEINGDALAQRRLLACRCIAADLSQELLTNIARPVEITRHIVNGIKEQIKEESKSREEDNKSLLTEPHHLLLKALLFQAGFVSKYCAPLRHSLQHLAVKIGIMDRTWSRALTFLFALSLTTWYHEVRRDRQRGEFFAACRITSFFRAISTRRKIAAIWNQAEEECRHTQQQGYKYKGSRSKHRHDSDVHFTGGNQLNSLQGRSRVSSVDSAESDVPSDIDDGARYATENFAAQSCDISSNMIREGANIEEVSKTCCTRIDPNLQKAKYNLSPVREPLAFDIVERTPSGVKFKITAVLKDSGGGPVNVTGSKRFSKGSSNHAADDISDDDKDRVIKYDDWQNISCIAYLVRDSNIVLKQRKAVELAASMSASNLILPPHLYSESKEVNSNISLEESLPAAPPVIAARQRGGEIVLLLRTRKQALKDELMRVDPRVKLLQIYNTNLNSRLKVMGPGDASEKTISDFMGLKTCIGTYGAVSQDEVASNTPIFQIHGISSRPANMELKPPEDLSYGHIYVNVTDLLPCCEYSVSMVFDPELTSSIWENSFTFFHRSLRTQYRYGSETDRNPSSPATVALAAVSARSVWHSSKILNSRSTVIHHGWHWAMQLLKASNETFASISTSNDPDHSKETAREIIFDNNMDRTVINEGLILFVKVRDTFRTVPRHPLKLTDAAAYLTNYGNKLASLQFNPINPDLPVSKAASRNRYKYSRNKIEDNNGRRNINAITDAEQVLIHQLQESHPSNIMIKQGSPVESHYCASFLAYVSIKWSPSMCDSVECTRYEIQRRAIIVIVCGTHDEIVRSERQQPSDVLFTGKWSSTTNYLGDIAPNGQVIRQQDNLDSAHYPRKISHNLMDSVNVPQLFSETGNAGLLDSVFHFIQTNIAHLCARGNYPLSSSRVDEEFPSITVMGQNSKKLSGSCVNTGLSFHIQYRVRAINSIGTGKYTQPPPFDANRAQLKVDAELGVACSNSLDASLGHPLTIHISDVYANLDSYVRSSGLLSDRRVAQASIISSLVSHVQRQQTGKRSESPKRLDDSRADTISVFADRGVPIIRAETKGTAVVTTAADPDAATTLQYHSPITLQHEAFPQPTTSNERNKRIERTTLGQAAQVLDGNCTTEVPPSIDCMQEREDYSTKRTAKKAPTGDDDLVDLDQWLLQLATASPLV